MLLIRAPKVVGLHVVENLTDDDLAVISTMGL